MSQHTRIAANLGLAALMLLGLSIPPPARATTDIITFDNLPNEPGRNGGVPFSVANGGNATFDGVTFSANSNVLGDQFFSPPLVTPHSGNYAFAAAGQTTTLTTTKTLYGLYLGLINHSSVASSVTINALGAGGTMLASLTDPLTSTTESFFDTSSFASLTGITGYTLVGFNPNNANSKDFAGDDFTFSAPTPPVVSGTFDFESNTVGQQTTFTDTSGGIKAIFSSNTDASIGGFTVQNNAPYFVNFSSNFLESPGGFGDIRLLSIAFDHTLGGGSVAFASGSAGTFTVQELRNGQVVGTATSTGTLQGNYYQGTLAFGDVSFDSLVLSDPRTDFAIDNLKVSSAPEPSQTAALAFTGLGLGGLLLRARKQDHHGLKSEA